MRSFEKNNAISLKNSHANLQHQGVLPHKRQAD
jgi:hypothetical protein